MEDIQDNSYLLASRWSRFCAVIIDGLIIAVIVAPISYFTGGFDGLMQNPPVQASLSHQLLMALVGATAYSVINWKSLKQCGQTIGTKAMKIRIVKVDGSPATAQELIFKRYAFYQFSVYIPIIGVLIALISFVMMLGKERRPLHDRLAKTKVILTKDVVKV